MAFVGGVKLGSLRRHRIGRRYAVGELRSVRKSTARWSCVVAPERAAVGDFFATEDLIGSSPKNGLRQSKLVCTIGPKTASKEMMIKLAETGMNVVRMNMSHGTHEWHQMVIDITKEINEEGVYNLGLLLDTKGPEVRSGDLKNPIEVERGQEFIWTIRKELPSELGKFVTEVSYDDFVNDVHVGDTLLVDGGICSFLIKEVTETDVITECIDGGTLTSRRHLNVRGKSASLPAITEKDWQDIAFGMKNGVDFYALSFVKHPDDVMLLQNFSKDMRSLPQEGMKTMLNPRSDVSFLGLHVSSFRVETRYLREKGDDALVLAKIESAGSMDYLREILVAADGAMVARGDLGSEIPFEDVPLVQEDIVMINRSLKKPTIVATHMLESMIENPTPTRAEVTDIQKALMQGADATMLSGETAGGKFPLEAVDVMTTVSRSVFSSNLEEDYVEPAPVAGEESERVSIAYSTSVLAKKLDAAAIVCFTRKGSCPRMVSSARPHVPIIAYCPVEEQGLVRSLSLCWGVRAFPLEFPPNPEETISAAMEHLKARGIVQPKDYVVFTSDILVPSTDDTVNTIQVRMII